MSCSRGKKRSVAVETFDSDDERAYSKEKLPDPSAAQYYYDEVDEFHLNQEKMLLDKGAPVHEHDENMSEEEEVLGVDDDDDDDDADERIAEYEARLRKMRSGTVRESMASDLEDDDDNDDGGDVKAWGKQKSMFYGADVVDKKKKKKSTTVGSRGGKKGVGAGDGDSGEELDADALEEREALAIQRRLAAELNDDDFGLNLIKASQPPVMSLSSTASGATEERITKDITTLSKQEKLQLLKKESPELLSIIEDYKEKLKILHDDLLPLLKCYKDGLLPPSTGVSYLQIKTQLYLDYCTNISFYLTLKYKRRPVHDHPVIKRIVTYRNMIRQLSIVDERLRPMMVDLQAKVKAGQLTDISSTQTDDHQLIDFTADLPAKHITAKKRHDFAEVGDQNDDVEEAKKNTEENEEEEEEDERRAIGYTIEKNRGLKPRRKKELRNPRVKHREKYRKAIINRRGQIREVQREMTKYGGEASGIRAAIKKSIKLKV